ncbi:hypothetical protein REPUB_Repub20aG0100300 [Reevesia pubescens]
MELFGEETDELQRNRKKVDRDIVSSSSGDEPSIVPKPKIPVSYKDSLLGETYGSFYESTGITPNGMDEDHDEMDE